MSTWITIHTSVTSQEALIIKAHLELQEIEVNLLDEHATMYTLNFANGSGGVRLQVHENQVEQAIAFLVENGYMPASSKRNSGPISWLSSVSSKIPVLKNWRVEARLIFIATILLLPFIIALAVNDLEPKRTLSNQLYGMWCIKSLTHNGKKIPVRKDKPILVINGCYQNIYIDHNQRCLIPGYGDSSTMVNYDIHDDWIRISKATNALNGESNYLLGAFDVTFADHDNRLILRSPTTKVVLNRIH